MAYTVVQHTNSLTFGSNLTAGNSAFLGITYNASFSLTAVSGSTNGAYSLAGTSFNNSGNTGRKLEIWFKGNVAAGAETLSLTGITGANVTGWFVIEANGLGSAPSVDVQATNSNAAGTPVATINPTGADFLVAVIAKESGSPGGTLTNLTSLNTLNADADYWWSTAGSGSINCSDAGYTAGAINVIAFKASSGNVTETFTGNLLVTATQAALVGTPVTPLTTGILSLTGRVIVQGFTPPPPSGGTTVTNPPWWWAWIK